MSGSLIQLSANSGVQDKPLFSQPEQSFYRSSFKRCTNFAIEPLVLSTGLGNLGASVHVNIERAADLVGEMFLQTRLKKLEKEDDLQDQDVVTYVNGIGHALLESASVEIGGMEIDRLDSDILHCHDQVFGRLGRELKSMCMYRHALPYGQPTTEDILSQYVDSCKDTGVTLYTPLKFWFNQSPQNYLPLVSLQLMDVDLVLQTRPIEQLIKKYNAGAAKNMESLFEGMDLVCEYVFLDEAERRAMSQEPRDYMIQTYQTFKVAGQHAAPAGGETTVRAKLALNHPVSHMHFFVKESGKEAAGDFFDYSTHRASAPDVKIDTLTGGAALDAALLESTDSTGQNAPIKESVTQPGTAWGTNTNPEYLNAEEFRGLGMYVDPIKSAQLRLNNNPRWSRTKMDGRYFREVQPYMRCPRQPDNFVYTYSFALNPANTTTVSGSCNFSRVDNTNLSLDVVSSGVGGRFAVHVIAVAWNVLVVRGGRAGLQFAN